MDYLKFVIFFACANVGIYIVLAKWRVIESYSLYKKKWMPACDFCFFFWIFVIEFLVNASSIVLSFEFIKLTIICGLAAAAISRKLL